MTTQPIRDKRQIRALVNYYLNLGQLRNYVLIVLGLYTALRISDLLRLTWDDVYDFKNNCVKKSIDIIEKKTRKAKKIALNQAVIDALTLFAAQNALPGRALIENPRTKKPISRIQAYRLIRDAAEKSEVFTYRISPHSLRKTFGYHAWKSGVSPAVIMEIYNHSSLAVTRRYLGVTQDDKDDVYLKLTLMV
jgi:integrase